MTRLERIRHHLKVHLFTGEEDSLWLVERVEELSYNLSRAVNQLQNDKSPSGIAIHHDAENILVRLEEGE